MEHLGRGISQMITEMRKLELEEPIFSKGNDFFKAVFKGNEENINLRNNNEKGRFNSIRIKSTINRHINQNNKQQHIHDI